MRRCARWPTATGARLAWVPRRAGERGAVEAGTLPGLLPGGRPVEDADRPGRRRRGLGRRLAAGRSPGVTSPRSSPPPRPVGSAALVVVAASTSTTCPTPRWPGARCATAPFVVSLEVRSSSVTEHADVVLPVAPVAEKSGSFLNWEGRRGAPSTPPSPRRAMTRRAGPARPCRPARRRPAACPTPRPPAPSWPSSAPGRARGARRADRAGRRAAGARAGRGRAVHLGPDARHRPAARTASRTSPAPRTARTPGSPRPPLRRPESSGTRRLSRPGTPGRPSP